MEVVLRYRCLGASLVLSHGLVPLLARLARVPHPQLSAKALQVLHSLATTGLAATRVVEGSIGPHLGALTARASSGSGTRHGVASCAVTLWSLVQAFVFCAVKLCHADDFLAENVSIATALATLLRDASVGLARLDDPEVLGAVLSVGGDAIAEGRDDTPVCVTVPLSAILHHLVQATSLQCLFSPSSTQTSARAVHLA